VVDPFEIPLHWPRGYGLDVGWNRTAAVWGAQDRDTDTVWPWSEHYRGQAEPSVHAAVDAAARGRGQKDGEQLLQNDIDLGLPLTKADNGVEAGLFDVWERLSTGRLKVFRTLQSWLAEYRLYRRDEKGAARKFIVSGLPLCLAPPDAGRRLVRGGDGQSNHQSDCDPFEEL